MKIRQFVFFILLIVIVILIATNLGQLHNFTNLLLHLNLWILSSILLIRYLSYWSNTHYFISILKVFNKKINFAKAFIGVVIMNFVNTIIPTGGISGASYLSLQFEPEIPASVTTVSQIGWYILSTLSYFFVLIFGLLSLFLSNQISQISFRVVLVLITFVVIIGAVIIVIITNRQLTQIISWTLVQPINFFFKVFKKPAVTRDSITKFIDEFYDQAKFLLRSRDQLKGPLGYCLLGGIAELLSIYVVFLAFGKAVNPGIVIAGYSLAMLSSFSSVFTSGVGVYEAAMVATFVALGLPFALSASVVLVYRFIAFWLFLPVGLYFYKRTTVDGA